MITNITLDDFEKAIKFFISNACEKKDDHLVHKQCGGSVRIGFINLFYINPDGTLDPGSDGFGIGPKRVPYCEKCFPPNGFNYTYAFRFPITRDENKKQKEQELFTWGNPKLLKS